MRETQQQEVRNTRQQQNELRDLLRFYHKHEGEIFDICQTLRQMDEKVEKRQEKRHSLNEQVTGLFRSIKSQQATLFLPSDGDTHEVDQLKEELRRKLAESTDLKVRLEAETSEAKDTAIATKRLLSAEQLKTRQLFKALDKVRDEYAHRHSAPGHELRNLQSDSRVAQQQLALVSTRFSEVQDLTHRAEAMCQRLKARDVFTPQQLVF